MEPLDEEGRVSTGQILSTAIIIDLVDDEGRLATASAG